MSKEEKHLFLTETESARCGTDFKIEEHDLLTDFKVLLKEYYVATFTDDGNALILNFTNGQKFKLALTEIK